MICSVRGTAVQIDEEDLELLLKYAWRTFRKKNGVSYVFRRSSGGKFFHHLILPSIPGLVVDHINGDGLDNRRKNLRYATPQQSAMNRGKPRSGKAEELVAKSAGKLDLATATMEAAKQNPKLAARARRESYSRQLES